MQSGCDSICDPSSVLVTTTNKGTCNCATGSVNVGTSNREVHSAFARNLGERVMGLICTRRRTPSEGFKGSVDYGEMARIAGNDQFQSVINVQEDDESVSDMSNKKAWVPDSARTRHMYSSSHSMFDYKPCDSTKSSTAVNSQAVPVVGHGKQSVATQSHAQNFSLRFRSVVHFPRLNMNAFPLQTAVSDSGLHVSLKREGAVIRSMRTEITCAI